MNIKTKISHSQISTYTTCPRKFKFHYIDRLRSKYQSGALLFGSAIDIALNDLLKNKDESAAIKKFDKTFRYNYINSVGHYIPECTLVTYADKDFDDDLLLDEDREKYKEVENKYGVSNREISATYEQIKKQKKSQGWINLSDIDKKLYNTINWLSMRRKGHIMIKSYNKKVIPQIKNVLAVQKHFKIENELGDQLTGIIDLIVEFNDGKRFLMDNKTSAIRYDQERANRSQQLIGYFPHVKEEYKLDGVGFFVMYKQILKNKVKICKSCGKNGSGGRFKTCDSEIESKRCNGEWQETIDPECEIETILNSNITQQAEDLVLATFDEANEGIKNQQFNPNLNACSDPFPCQYAKYCWENNKEELVQLEKKK
jgi:hypothetical protein